MPLTAWMRTLFLPSTLLSRWVLHLLFWVNFLGTIYGYEWYWGQMEQTIVEKPLWMIVFVPDSPTASLFFTVTLLYLLRDWSTGRLTAEASLPRHDAERPPIIRSIIEALAVITSFKYGVWAVMIIAAGIAKGSPVVWEDGMLSCSHLGMAVEALIFLRFYRITRLAFVIGALWTLTNDIVDYTFGVYPNLPRTLWNDVPVIGFVTFCLTAVSVLISVGLYRYYHNKQNKASV